MRSHSNALVKGLAPFLLALVALAGRPAAAVAQSQTATYGGIEIGAKGVKATVIRVTLNKQGQATGIGKPLLQDRQHHPCGHQERQTPQGRH